MIMHLLIVVQSMSKNNDFKKKKFHNDQNELTI